MGQDSPPELPKQYRPADHEGRVRAAWEGSGAFHADPGRVLRGEAEPYCVLIPPPNVTDRLHLGHALNNTIQDILVRAHRMMGYETLWMPGTDHAGIATQAVVERRLRKDGKLKGPLKQAMKREEFVAIIQSFKDEYEATITGQLKAMGCSCDWARQRFTMDEVCARAVQEAFFLLFKEGLIYRGKRLVNWDPALQTAVADDETEEIEVDGFFFHLRYPLVHPHGAATDRERARGQHPPQDAVPVSWSELAARGYPGADQHPDEEQAWVTVATTRPETYLGDTAVGVNPKDPRAHALRGLVVELPLVGRLIPIIEDEYVVMPAAMQRDAEAAKDPKAVYATGFLKVTPAHDQNDYELGQRHGLKLVNVMAPDASISDKHGWEDVGDAGVFLGLKREDARKKVLEEFKARGLLEEAKPYRHGVKHSDRSKAVIEPYLSDQWYVKVTDERMRGAALGAMAGAAKQRGSETARQGKASGDGALRLYPERYAKTYQSWHENIRDWCISRQLWWGHQIPVWHYEESLTSEDVEISAQHPVDVWNPNDYWQWLHGMFVVLFPDDTELASFGERLRVAQDPTAPPVLSADRFIWIRKTNAIAGKRHWFFCVTEEFPRDLLTVLEARGFKRDSDVLDTWFSSALWPMSTMGWPDPKDAEAKGKGQFAGMLEAFNPSSTLCTAREIITLWVSRMVMFNRYFMPQAWPKGELGEMGRGKGPVPFRDVFIHAMIQDGEGRKMSKSLNNGVDPLDIIATHGTDAMRFTLCQMTTQTQDVRMPVVKDAATGRNTSSKFDLGRNLCNKLWNAGRFALGILAADGGRDARPTGNAGGAMTLPDRWMLSRLAAAVDEINGAIRDYQFSAYAQAVYDLLWRDFCDWYLEAIKPTVATNPAQRAVLAHALETIVRLLHPIAPFITETIWEQLKNVETRPVPGIALAPSRGAGLLCTAGWPIVDPQLRDLDAEKAFAASEKPSRILRDFRAVHGLVPKQRLNIWVPRGSSSPSDPAALPPYLRPESNAFFVTASGVASIDFSSSAPLRSWRRCDVEEQPLYVEVIGETASDPKASQAAERVRLERMVADLDKTIKTLEGRLSNPGYAERAPAAMVQQTRDQLEKARGEREAAAAALARLR